MLERLGDFVVKDKLGEGGMGAVYLGFQESLERDVALKVLTERLCKNDKFIARFKREARSAASIVHPNVIQIYSIGEQDGEHYFAMEYVRGKDLTQLLAEGRHFSIAECIDIVMQVAEALACASERGIVHRDIKPANIMLTDRDLVKVTDFGLAKSVSSDLDVTEAGTIVGTANYMSPEQGRGQPLDVRSDIYSLGVVFFELLAGRIPFIADQPSAVLYMHIYENPPKPSEFNKEVSPTVDRMVLRMLAKDPEDRPHDADVLLQELKSVRQSLGVATPAMAVQGTAELAQPAVQSSIEQPAQAETPTPQFPAGTLKALVADDVASVRRLYSRVLSEMGFATIEASDGEEAYSLWTEKTPDLVLLDISMPKMSGIDILDKVGNLVNESQVIIISAQKDRDTVVEALRHGVRSYLTKPVNLDELRSRISKIMSLPSVRRVVHDVVAKRAPNMPSAEEAKHLVVYDPTTYSRNLCRLAAESLGYVVAGVTTLKEVDDILKEDTPDALVVTIGDTDAQCMDFLERLSRDSHSFPVVTIADNLSAPLRMRLEKFGLGPILFKPLRLDAFRDALDTAMDSAPERPRSDMHSMVFSQIVEKQLEEEQEYTVFDFVRTLAKSLPQGARTSFEQRMQEGSVHEIRNAAKNLLRRMRQEEKLDEAMRYVRHAYLHGNLDVRNLCLGLFGEMLPRAEEIDILLKIITDEDYRIRCRVLTRLQELHADEALPIIVRFLNDDVWKVRKTAAACLEAFDLQKVLEPLIRFYARSREPLPDRIRAMMLRNTHAREIDILEKIAHEGDAECRAFIAKFMGDLKSKLSVRLLETLIADKSPLVRVEAAKAVGRIRSEALFDKLLVTLMDSNSEVQASAVAATLRYSMTPSAVVFLDALSKRGKRIKREAIALLKAFIGDAQFFHKLLENLAGANDEQRKYLSLLLSHLFSERAQLDEIIRLLNATDKHQRAQAIRRIQQQEHEMCRHLSRAASESSQRIPPGM